MLEELPPPCPIPLEQSPSALTLPPTPSPPLYPSPLPSSPPPDPAAVVMATPPTGARSGRGGRRRGSRSEDVLRRPYHRVTPAAPDWVVQLEERRLVTEQGIAAALQELNVTLHGMRVAMESVAQSLQGISRHLD